MKSHNEGGARFTEIIPKGRKAQKGSVGGGTGELPDESPKRYY